MYVYPSALHTPHPCYLGCLSTQQLHVCSFTCTRFPTSLTMSPICVHPKNTEHIHTNGNLPVLAPSTDPRTSGPRRPMWEAETGLQTRTSHNPHELRQLRTVLPGPPWREGHTKPCLSLDYHLYQVQVPTGVSSIPCAALSLSLSFSLCLCLSLPPSWSPSLSVAWLIHLNQATNPQLVQDGQS